MRKNKDYKAQHEIPDEPAESSALNEQFVEKSGGALRFTRYVLLCILVLILALVLMTHRDSINLDNLQRMWAKLDFSQNESETAGISYDNDGMAATFKDGVAILSPSVLEILNNTGEQFMTVKTGFGNPALLTNDRYVVAYDRGGTHLLVTNSFSVVFDKTMNENITLVTVSEDNYLTVITSGGGYKNNLYVYNDSFEEVYAWHSNERYLLSGEVSPDEKSVAVICYNISGGTTAAEMVGIRLDKEEISWTAALEDLPLDMCYKSASSVALLYDDRLEFFASNGEKQNTYAFEKNFLQAYHMDADRTVICLSGSKRGESTVYSISNRGKVSSRFEMESAVHDMAVCDGRLALLDEANLTVYSLLSERQIYQQSAESSVNSICFAGKNTLLNIYNTYCVYNVIG